MANGVQLATAYISLNVRTDDIKKQVSSALSGAGSQSRQIGSSIGSKIADGIRSHLGGSMAMSIFNPMEIAGVRWAVRAGATIGSTLKKAISGALAGLGIGSLLGIGGALTAGLDRLKTIQRAQVQLSLKLDPNEIRRVTKDIQDVVRGTPIALDEALQAVPRALSAGIKPGKELNQYVQDIADAAASTGGQAGFGQIDIIFSQVLGKGKLMGEELMQLTENGVDLRSALKEAFGWDDKTLLKNIEKGKVGMKEIQVAVEKTWGGLSKKMGGTFDGAIGNLKASVARLGANIIGALFGDPKNPDDPLKGAIDGIGALTAKLDTAGKWVAEHREDIRAVFDGVKDAAGKAVGAVGWVIDKFGKVKTAAQDVANWFGGAWDKVTSAVSRVGDKVSSVVDTIKTKIKSIADEIGAKFNSIFGENGWFAQQFDKLGRMVDKVRDILGLGPATAGAADVPFNPGPSRSTIGTGPSLGQKGTVGGKLGSTGAVGGSQRGTVGGRLGPAQAAAQPAGTARVLNFDQSITGQEFSWDCGPGSAQIILNGQAVIKSEKDLIAEMGTTGGGTNFGGGNISGPLNNAVPGANYREIQGGNVPTDQFFNDISKSVNAGRGAMLNWNTAPGGPVPIGIKGTQATPYQGSDIAHYVAVMGVDPADQSMLIADPKDGRQYWITAQNAADLMRNRGYIADTGSGYSNGGGVWGAGSATSDSIPALLSNGEHVLTAADVKALGGQQGVYAFRNALQQGKVPGFAPGGPVDPNQVQDMQNSIADMQSAAEVAKAQYDEVMNSGDATDLQKMEARQNLERTKRTLGQAQQDLPVIQAGGTPPDRSLQNQLFDTTDQLAVAQERLKQAQAAGDVPQSQMLQLQYDVAKAQRGREQAIGKVNQQDNPNYLDQFVRSMGFIPANASSTGVAGTSTLSKFIGMGSEIVGQGIDLGTMLAKTAVSAAIMGGAAAGSFGAAAPAAPFAAMAANYGIQLAGATAKRVSEYWFQMGSIGADALMEQIFPFGAPRWLGYDYAQFMPQLGIIPAATSTLEQMGTDAINKAFNPQGKPTIPPSPGGQGSIPTPAPGMAPQQVQVGAPNPMPTQGQFSVPMTPQPPAVSVVPTTPINPLDIIAGGVGGGGSWARGGAIGVYDNGGMLYPGQLALNASRTPEPILTNKQWDAMLSNASTKGRDAPLVQNLYAQDMQDAIRQLQKVQSRNMMQYAGRS